MVYSIDIEMRNQREDSLLRERKSKLIERLYSVLENIKALKNVRIELNEAGAIDDGAIVKDLDSSTAKPLKALLLLLGRDHIE